MEFLQQLGLVVVDELHMLADPNRGGVLEYAHRENQQGK